VVRNVPPGSGPGKGVGAAGHERGENFGDVPRVAGGNRKMMGQDQLQKVVATGNQPPVF
jgi:hypothetical protein